MTVSEGLRADDTHEDEIRIGRNQSLFRDVNERIEELRTGSYPLTEIDFICECADDGCFEKLSVTIGEYEAVRAEPDTFLVAPEHVFPEAEVVVLQHEGYWVVKKIAVAKRVALAMNPRQPDKST